MKEPPRARISHTPPITAAYRTESIGENGDLDAQRSAATPPLKIAIFSNIFSTLRSLITVVYGISGLVQAKGASVEEEESLTEAGMVA